MEFDKLTIFYNRRTGTIKEMCTGEQTMDWFGSERKDYEQIFDYVVVDYDAYVMQNPNQFEIKDGQVKLKQEAVPSKYL
ncbi:hypothetical protein SAMN02745973_00362 [Garciella nitratireducens DSM 15102]|uniref:Uncharacterized protein n=2 Tax=Garciella TaxID=218204 RepID=A0A1T4K638_9FIRM|nr:hypothetical protein SAMN02745973_00362 [Garciella nitratireducens DSM 15102]